LLIVLNRKGIIVLCTVILKVSYIRISINLSSSIIILK
jgi:hypothetical protein